MMTINDCVTV